LAVSGRVSAAAVAGSGFASAERSGQGAGKSVVLDGAAVAAAMAASSSSVRSVVGMV
jgi:hypothetical protein